MAVLIPVSQMYEATQPQMENLVILDMHQYHMKAMLSCSLPQSRNLVSEFGKPPSLEFSGMCFSAWVLGDVSNHEVHLHPALPGCRCEVPIIQTWPQVPHWHLGSGKTFRHSTAAHVLMMAEKNMGAGKNLRLLRGTLTDSQASGKPGGVQDTLLRPSSTYSRPIGSKQKIH